MMLQIGDDGVVSSVDEENLIYVDKNELEQFIESYQKLEKENECLKDKLCELGVSDVKCQGKRIDTGLDEWLMD